MLSLKLRGKKIIVVLLVIMMLFVLYHLSSNEFDIKSDSKHKGDDMYGKNSKSYMSQLKSQVVEDSGTMYVVPEEGDSLIKSVKIVSPVADKVTEFKSSGKSKIFSGNRIVHLDLKGAAPKLSYYSEFFPLIKILGATGVIIEYEDMFPYSRTELSAMNAYSKDEIKHILKLANENKLEVIPLIQTFGHLEFLLKLQQYEHLREKVKYPQVICPTKNETTVLLKEMVDDILALHPQSNYLHIGCDEVYYLGECYSCIQAMAKERWTKQQLFLSHVTMLARYIREKYPKITTLTWDDEFRKMTQEELIYSGIGSLIEPVIWKYTPNIDTYLPETLWDKYAKVFSNVWIASAYKGATGPDKYITDIGYHLENHKAWMKLVATYSDKINFKGIILTGWQRYDHFAILCELLPVGIPSLATNLLYIASNNIDLTDLSEKVRSLLKCGSSFLRNNVGSHCGFPGAGIYDVVVKLDNLSEQIKQTMESSLVKGWLTPYNIEIGISNPSHVEEATLDLDRYKMELLYLEQDMVKQMSEMYGLETVTEWIDTNIKPLKKELQTLWDGKEKILEKHDWPRRPFSTKHNRDL